ncbi:MAG: hypothetical protein Q8P26_04010 [Candidatus Levybacteria bacterium]|nr:hypothetical protein [Candidatus Levybacteria bacterium]
MKLFFYSIITIITLYNIFIGTTLVRNNEVTFFSDIARDFLLLQELDEKKIVLIGPRSSTNGLFHGPLWTYINYPAYILGQGNPIAVAWFWNGLGVVFLVTSFFIIKKMFGTLPAATFALLVSAKMAPNINHVFHAEAAFFFTPLFFFAIYMYVKSSKNIYLALHLLATTIIIQLEIGVGIQFLALSSLVIFWFIVKNKLWKHLLTLSLIPIFLSNFILFDFNNNFRMATALLSTGTSSKFFVTLSSWVENRINNAISLQLVDNPNNLFTIAVFAIVIFFSILLIKNKSKYRYAYLLFLFYYFGYLIMSFFNKGILLYHYTYLLIPITFLWLVSFLATRYRNFFIPLILIIFALNLQNAQSYINSRLSSVMGKDYNSWRSLSAVASEVIALQKGQEFGYFVFAPDALAYQPRYAMLYNFKKSNAKAFEYIKRSTTYVIAAPPPADDPYMTYEWWSKVPVGISSKPVETKKFPSGFTVVKYNLSSEEQKIPHDKAIELGIHFR